MVWENWWCRRSCWSRRMRRRWRCNIAFGWYSKIIKKWREREIKRETEATLTTRWKRKHGLLDIHYTYTHVSMRLLGTAGCSQNRTHDGATTLILHILGHITIFYQIFLVQYDDQFAISFYCVPCTTIFIMHSMWNNVHLYALVVHYYPLCAANNIIIIIDTVQQRLHRRWKSE